LKLVPIKVGDRIVFSPTNKTSTVKTIERFWNASFPRLATAGEVDWHHVDRTDLRRTWFGWRPVETAPPYELNRFKARLFWLGRAPFRKGKLQTQTATQEVDCEIETIEKVIRRFHPGNPFKKGEELFVGRHEVAELDIAHQTPDRFRCSQRDCADRRFVIVDGFDGSGGGIVAPDHLSETQRRWPS